MQDTTKNKVNMFIIITIFIGIGVAGFMYVTRDVSSPKTLVSTPTEAIKSPVDSMFLTALLELKKHNIDKTFFDTKEWNSLRDFSKTLTPQEKFRPNPFAPISTTSTQTQF